MDGEDRVVRAELPAAVDDLLAAALHLGVLALHGGEIEPLVTAPRCAGGRGAAAETDEHCRSAEHDEAGARRDGGLPDLVRADVADPARDHDGLVVAVHPCVSAVPGAAFLLAAAVPSGPLALRGGGPPSVAAAPCGDGVVRLPAASLAARRPGRADPRDLDLKGAEVSAEGRASELVVERGGADRAVEHDLQRGSDPRGPAVVMLPRLDEAREAQVGDREPGDPCLAAGAPAGRRLVADLAAGAGGGAREGRDGGGMVVGLHLHQDLHPPGHGRVPPGARIRNEPARRMSAHHRRVVAVRGQHLPRVTRLRVTDHVEQRTLMLDAVDDPRRVEDLVAAVLGIDLREHHQLRVGRIPAELSEPDPQVIDLPGAQCEPEGGVRRLQGAARVRAEGDRGMGRWRPVQEDRLHSGPRAGVVRKECVARGRALRHAVVEQARAGERSPDLAGVAAGMGDRPRHTALDARHPFEAAAAGDVGGLARPRRDRSRTRRHDDRAGQHRVCLITRDQRGIEEPLDDPRRDVAVAAADEVDPAPVEIGHRGLAGTRTLQEALAAKRRQDAPSPEHQDGGDEGSRGVHWAGAMGFGLHGTGGTGRGAGR